jgi:outer membrane protein OmpA-like peptidoglycan-associated protein
MKKMKITHSIVFLLLNSLIFAQNGLVGEYFNGTNFQTKVLTRTDAKLDFSWGTRGPAPGQVNGSDFSARWTGRLFAPVAGDYIFTAKVDDGIRVYIDNQLVINAWSLHDMGDFSAKIRFEANSYHDIKIEYFNALIEGELTLNWIKPDAKKSSWNPFADKTAEPIGSKYFFQPKTPVNPIAAKSIPKPEIKNQKSLPPSVKPAVKPSKTDEIVNAAPKTVLKNVFFEKSTNKMTDNSVERLDLVVAYLKANSKKVIELSGHTDVLGDAQLNKDLSEKRAQVVADYLISKNIAAERIVLRGFGSTQPFNPNPKSEEERAMNRRVEFVLR